MVEYRPGAFGVEELQTPMLELSSESLRQATEADLDRILEEYLGITARKFWSRAKKITHLLSAASAFLDQDEP